MVMRRVDQELTRLVAINERGRGGSTADPRASLQLRVEGYLRDGRLRVSPHNDLVREHNTLKSDFSSNNPSVPYHE